MVYELDAGDVLAERILELDLDIDAAQLSLQLSEMGGQLLAEYLHSVSDSLVGTPQDAAKVTLAPKIKKEEAFWQPTWSARETHNRARAFCVWPGIWMSTSAGTFKVLKTRLSAGATSHPPATVFLEGDKVLCSCGVRSGEMLELLTVQAPNKASGAALTYFKSLWASSRQETAQLLKVEALS